MKIRGMRWWIVVLLFLAAVLNYIDRQTLSALAPTIQVDLRMDDNDYANVINIFLIAYTIAYLISGRMADKLGTRTGMFIFVAWWSIANMLTAAARGVNSLGIYRFMLGLGEAGIWPAASKAVSEWFPAKERGIAIGLYTMGATIGATVAPYVVIPLATYRYAEGMPILHDMLGNSTGWRVAFILTGFAGLLWLIPWAGIYRKPGQSKMITKNELSLIENAEKEVDPADLAPANAWSWKRVLMFRGAWLLLLGRLITDPVWYFYQFWFPKYLSSDRGLTQENLKITWVIYAGAGIGSILGGLLSGYFIKRGTKAPNSRMWIMLGCAFLMPLSPFVASFTGLNYSMLLAFFTVLASLAWLTNISSLVVDVVPKHSLGTVFSVVAAGSTIGGILMNMLVATMVSTGSSKSMGFLDKGLHAILGPILELVKGGGYPLWFLIMAFLHPLAWLMLKVGGVERLSALNSDRNM